jgi:hypothetical protein
MDVVGGVKHYLFKKDEATTDNITFRIHYRVSFTILLACMGLVSCNHLYRVSFTILLACMGLVSCNYLYWVSFTILLACMGLVSCNFLLRNPLVICKGFPSPNLICKDASQSPCTLIYHY